MVCARNPAGCYVRPTYVTKKQESGGSFAWEKRTIMMRLRKGSMGIALLGSGLLVAMAGAQQKSAPQQNQGYETSREVSVQGAVVRYSETSEGTAFGPHVIVQTSSGALDVHLGNARLLENSHFTLAAGDSIRVIGENVALGTGMQFVARIVQKDGQTVVLRSAQGFP